MKQTIFLSIIMAGLLFSGFLSPTPPITQGMVEFTIKDIKADNLNAITKMMVSDSKITVHFKDSWVRTKMDLPFVKQTTIVDGGSKKGLVLVEKFMEKVAVHLDQQSLKDQQAKRGKVSSVSFHPEQKTIQGFLCKRAVIKTETRDELELYYTDKIQPNIPNSRFQVAGIDGFPLEMDMYRDGKKLRLLATDVDTQTVKADWFSLSVPKGFKVKGIDYLHKLREERE